MMRLAWALVLGPFFVDAAYPRLRQSVFESPPVSATPSLARWNLADEPSVNSTSQLIFSTVGSLLQHWPNTRYRNGHNIVPATMPVGTLLYHGAYRNEIPKVPDWTATDPELSYLFCGSLAIDLGCWHLTLVATRPLKFLYFDGSSAAKMLGGSMDTQDLVAWGEIKPERTFNEKQRITDLCDWGKKYGVDGYIRMEMDFEIMLCDFSAGVEPVSFLYLSPATPGRRPGHPPGNSQPSSSSFKLSSKLGARDMDDPSLAEVSALFRVLEGGSWHKNFPGDLRIQPDYTRLISFYDPVMFPSLEAARVGQNRLEHRLDGISRADAKAFAVRLEEVLMDDPQNSGSGVDWQSLIKVITDRFAERLELLHYLLNPTTHTFEPETNDPLKKAYRQITSMIVPYILHTARPPNDKAPSSNYAWAMPVFELCATTHTSYIESGKFLEKLTTSERVLLRSVKGVTKEICRVLVGLWAEGMELGLGEPDSFQARLAAPQEVSDRWNSKVEGLMAWLDWSYWLRCRPACSYEEMCYLPTWPFFRGWPRIPRQPTSRSLLEWIQASRNTGADFKEDPEQGEWVDPQPRCIRRVEPLQFVDDFAGLPSPSDTFSV
ncbi:hypothetical protein GALMADRAFT_1263513 [Galerina marginata CBS 339.88]|uniref:Uncharacterized protein n=1 Tax=Galerina marginata (strain CBS 339.88) TaxID=685588 RepID=A0A067T8K3_GALM3|nr:hypothetical protein GALMADRAFT_1263513 [Galerina marginata CBS 339.88]